MIGVLFLLISLFFGVQLIRFLVPDTRRLFVGIAAKQDYLHKIPSLLFLLPAGFSVGLITVTATTYYIALIIYSFVPNEMHVLYPANIVSLCLFAYLGSFFWQKCHVRNRKLQGIDAVEKTSGSEKRKIVLPMFHRSLLSIILYSLTILAITAAAGYICFHTFRMAGTILKIGPTVASDFSPHIAIMSSFSEGSNFPTQYPHFPGDNIQYHFFFYFLCGNLHLLGLPIDWALNLPSILTMVSALVLLGTLAVLISGRRLAFLITPLLVFFRSALNIIYQVRDLFAVPGATVTSVWKTLTNQTEWYVLTAKDDWGLWAINVYANQRHLMLGVSIILVLIYLFIPHLRRMFLHMNKASGIKEKLKVLFAAREAWLPRRNDPLHPYSLAILAILIVIVAPMFHGAALIAGLLVLLGMAIFSENRLTYAVVAVFAVASAILQTLLFSRSISGVVSVHFQPGFIVDNPSFLETVKYILRMSGLAVLIPILLMIGLLIYEIIRKKNMYRPFLLLAFSFPYIFAFLVIVSREMLSNHKFIQISLLLFDVFIAGFLSYLIILPIYFRRKKQKDLQENAPKERPLRVSPRVYVISQFGSIILALVIGTAMIGTGISEWFAFHNRNDYMVELNTESEMVEWIDKNTDNQAVFLTKDWYVHTFFLSGRMAYYGWPYYAWSAGHDTESRMHTYEWLLTGCDGNLETFRATCLEENIDYFLYDPELYSYRNGEGETIFNGEFFFENLTEIASFPNDHEAVIFAIQS